MEEPRNSAKRPCARLLLADAALLLMLCIGFYWKLVLTRQYTYLDTPDLAYQVLPWLQFQAAEWRRGHIPLWDPHLWGGQPLLGQAQPGAAYPLNWILFALPLRDGYLRQTYLHWYLVIVHFLAAWFAYLLCRDLGRSRGASVLGGMLFSLSGWLAQNELPQMINGAVWTPLVFLFLFRALRGQKPVSSAGWSGFFYGFSWLSGHHQIPLFVGLAALGLWLYAGLREGRPNWRTLKLGAVFVLIAALVSGLQTLPAYDYGKHAKRWVGAQEPKAWNEPVPYSVHGEYSLQASSLVGLLIPGFGRHFDPYAGLVALALALLGLAAFWSERTVRYLVAIGLAGLLFSLGKNNVFHGILYAVIPMLEKARTPAFAAFMYYFSFSILTSYGIDAFSLSTNNALPRRASLALLLFGVFLLATGLVLSVAHKMPSDDRFLVTALAALLGAGLLRAWHSGTISPPQALVAVGLLMLLELGNVTGYFWANREESKANQHLKKLREHVDIAGFIRTIPFPVRCQLPDQEIPYNFGDWHGIDQFGGYTASLPVNLLRVPWAGPHGRALFGVNCAVAAQPPGGYSVEAFRGASGLAVYLNPEAYPRVWTVHEARRLASVFQIEAAFHDSAFDLRRTTFLLEEPPALETCAESDKVALTERSSGRVIIRAQMGCRGMVILGDSYFPGWKAVVDGKQAGLWEAYAAVRGVVVEKGAHTIEMRYRPASVYWGLAMTLSGLLGACVLSLLGSRRSA
ncbi:MAG: hypothetical protein ACUVXB_02360 [Bryobacteraceae bacterium]